MSTVHPLAERLRHLDITALEGIPRTAKQRRGRRVVSREWLGLLVDREATARDNKRLSRRLVRARFQQNAVIDGTDYRTARGLDRALFHKLGSCD